MSYVLLAFRVPAGTTAREFYESGAHERPAAGDDGPPDAQPRAAMEAIARALQAVDPSALRRDGEPDIEVSTGAVQVSLCPGQAEITVPYWFAGDEAVAAIEAAYAFAAVLREAAGYDVYDPQIGHPATEDATEAAVQAYVTGAAALDEIATARRPRRRGLRRRSR